MSSGIKIYKLKDLIRKNESGELGAERLKEIMVEIATAASFYPDHNILIDFRETLLPHDVGMTDILKTAMEVASYKALLTGKIANVVPQDKDRVAIAEKAEAAIQIKGIRYRIFTDFEAAIEWLSDVKVAT